jgi:thymidine kinase
MLRFYFGVMGSSNTAMLLMQRYNYLELGHCVALVKPEVDTRVGRDIVYSRVGLRAVADIVVGVEDDILEQIRWFDAAQGRRLQHVFIDEAQFLAERQVVGLADIAPELDIHCYGLKTDFMGNFFPGSQALLRFADVLQEVEASLCWCGAKALMNTRVDGQGNVIKSGEQVLIDDGTQISYIGLCYRHWLCGESRPRRPVPKGRAGKGGVVRVQSVKSEK